MEPKKVNDEKATKAKKKSPRKRRTKKSKAKISSNSTASKKARKNRNYPISPFQDSFEFAQRIYDFGKGQKVRRLAFFDHLEKSPDSGPSRMMVTNSGKYGLTTGGYTAEFLELTASGKIATSDEYSDYDRQNVKLKMVFEDIEVFKILYDKLQGTKLPNQAVIGDLLKEEIKGINSVDVNPLVDLFIVNAKYLNLLKVISGAERLVNFEYCLEGFSQSSESGKSSQGSNLPIELKTNETLSGKSQQVKIEDVCFYITPIGEDNSDERKHSDLFLGSIVEPALESIGLKVIRADQIDKPGTITKQIIEYLSKSKLVIADLSFNNPNVFYELAIRHALRLPTVQIIRKGDKIPFDVNNSRTIQIDDTNIYSLVPNLETYRSLIASQVRQALNDPDSVDNPLTAVYPNIKLTI